LVINGGSFPKEKIMGVSGGENHTLYVTDSRKLCATGLNMYGQLGSGIEESKQTVHYV